MLPKCAVGISKRALLHASNRNMLRPSSMNLYQVSMQSLMREQVSAGKLESHKKMLDDPTVENPSTNMKIVSKKLLEEPSAELASGDMAIKSTDVVAF